MKKTEVIKINTRDPDLSLIRDMARASREGKLIAFPTETVYGVGGPMSAKGVDKKLAELKNRPGDKPFSYHIGDWDMLDFLEIERTAAFRYITHEFWPGPLTLLVYNQSGEKIGIRFPSDRLATALINSAGEPFVATSANLSGSPSPFNADHVLKAFDKKIDYIIDGGTTELKQDSTILDLSEEEPVIIRKGANSKDVEAAVEKIKVGKFPRKKILVVCTGNSCRSPMAEGWLRYEVKKNHLDEEIEIDSCGIGTSGGRPPTPEAIYVSKNREIDITDHLSRACTRSDIIDSDIILAMSREHYTFITSLVPAAREKTKILNIEDPIGQPMPVYEKVFEEIDEYLQDNWKWLIA